MSPRIARLQCLALVFAAAAQFKAPPVAQASVLSLPSLNQVASAEIPRLIFTLTSTAPSPAASTTLGSHGQLLFTRVPHVWTTLKPMPPSSTQSPTPTPSTAPVPTDNSGGDTEPIVSPPVEATSESDASDTSGSGSRDAPVLSMPTGSLTDPPQPLAKEAASSHESSESSSPPTPTSSHLIADIGTAHATISLEQGTASNGDAAIPAQISMQAEPPSTGTRSSISALLLPIAAAIAAAVAIGVVALKVHQRRRHDADHDLQTPPMSSLALV